MIVSCTRRLINRTFKCQVTHPHTEKSGGGGGSLPVFGDKPVKFRVVYPQKNGTAVLKGLTNSPSRAKSRIIYGSTYEKY